jgi:hypothetical protein
MILFCTHCDKKTKHVFDLIHYGASGCSCCSSGCDFDLEKICTNCNRAVESWHSLSGFEDWLNNQQ